MRRQLQLPALMFQFPDQRNRLRLAPGIDQIPEGISSPSVSWGGGIGWQGTEPREADRDTTSQWLPFGPVGLLADEQQIVIAAFRQEAQHLRPLGEESGCGLGRPNRYDAMVWKTSRLVLMEFQDPRYLKPLPPPGNQLPLGQCIASWNDANAEPAAITAIDRLAVTATMVAG